MSDTQLLKYSDTRDKCFGIVGMTIGLAVLDCEKYIDSVSLERDDLDSIRFIPEFYVSGNPRFTTKAAWNFMIEKYNVMSAMIIGNVVCRSIVLHGKAMSADIMDELHRLLKEEAREMCSLDEDETDMIINKYVGYMTRMFNSVSLQSLAGSIASALDKHRELGRGEIIEYLSSIG